MNILTIENISKAFAEKVILHNATAGLDESDKIGIIGINGTGKTTLLRMVAGLEEPDEGQIVRKNGLRIAYLPQNPHFPEGSTVLSYVLGGAASGGTGSNQPADEAAMDPRIVSEAKRILTKLGMAAFDQQIAPLSGGQKKRVALARTLASTADLLILDEPTNHIDNEMVLWLEEYLQKYKGAVLMVTHDRYFLDRVTNTIWEVSRSGLYSYAGGYETFLQLKAEREEMALASERKRQSLLRMEEEWAMRGARARSTKQKARLQRLEALREGRAPETDGAVEMEALSSRMGKKTIELQHVSKGFEGRELIHDFSYTLLRGQRLGIIGPNGCGKTTLMKMLAGQLEPDAGCIEHGETIRIGYFAQEDESLDMTQRAIDAVREIAEYIPTKDGSISASQLMERFLFDGTLQYTPVGRLSGGERRRLQLLRVLAGDINTLLLDEPTNDLDIPTLTILEEFLNGFPGIVITVSHDRYFLDAVVDRIFAFENNGQLRQYEGGYTDYREAWERRRQEEERQEGAAAKAEPSAAGSAKPWKQNRPAKLKFSFQEQREFATIDDDIAALEEQAAAVEQAMADNATNYTKLTELEVEKQALAAKLEEKMERWVYLNDLAEKIEAQNSASV